MNTAEPSPDRLRPTTNYKFYVFNASYNDQPDIQIKVETDLRVKDLMNPNAKGYQFCKHPFSDESPDTLKNGCANEILNESELANYIAEMYGRIPKIFRKCVKEIWITKGRYQL